MALTKVIRLPSFSIVIRWLSHVGKLSNIFQLLPIHQSDGLEMTPLGVEVLKTLSTEGTKDRALQHMPPPPGYDPFFSFFSFFFISIFIYNIKKY